ncbi:ninein isoform X5 [Spea bombifrons]|uniref:ninein isoform X5 n=1 Tax=Spea bombifrons TaxID=233779 RepID=UPI00234B2B6C|nr:ninein isoform X5 [Spea bombifrons]
MEQDQYEAQLKELFDSFDSTGTGSLGQEELTDLCHTLQLEEVATFLQQALFQDNPLGRVHFDQFKEALIDVLSSRLSNKENFQETDCSSEAQPKYIKDGKRYGRRSVPELQDSLEEFDEETVIEAEDDGTRSSQVSSRNCEELWKNEEGEEYEAEGQLRFWNPDDLSASQNVLSSTQDWVEEKLQLVCEDLGITRDGHLNRKKLISICEQYGLQNVDKEVLEDAFQNLGQDDTMSLQDFFYEVCKNTKPLTPSSSTPYRQLKRHLSMQPYDESGRRTITPSSMTGSVGFRLFSKLDDGTGYGSVEDVIDLWQEDGVENSQAILKALDFNLEGKINLTELTMTLENELLMTKNEVYQAALTSFRSEIRYLLERADQAAREKEKLRSDLERNERFKNMMASEVDDHHAAIERRNEYNLRKLDEEYKEKTTALRSELRRERELILQQTSRQRMELEHELEKVKTEENNLRDRLTLSLKESTRLENELLETSEKLVEYETLANKLQRSLDNVLREKFGDLDPTCIEFFRQEEKLAQMRNEYERQRRELQDQIDELQLELEEYRLQGVRSFRSSLKNSLSFEMDSKNVMESDQGIGSDDCPPLNMSIEAEMAIEQMREQHQREVEHLRVELESNVTRYEEQVKELKCLYEREKEIVQQKSKEEAEKTEAQIHLLEKRQVELDAEIVTLKEAHQVAESEHKLQIHNMEAEFNKQRAQLIDQQAAIQLQLEETKRTFQIEKEELIRKAEEAERDLETKLVERVRMLEEEKEHLEHSYNEQIVKLQERHDIALNELTVKLLEQHQRNLQEDRCENKKLQEANAALKTEITALEEECETHNQKVTELQEAYEEMWVNLETAQNEKTAVHKTVENLTKQVSELKARNQQLDSENAELYLKNTKNQVDIQDMNRRLVTFLKQKDRKESAKGLEEWQKERCRLKDEIEVYRSKVSDAEKELSTVKVHSRFLEQENTLLKQEIETKQLSKCSEMAELKNEISALLNKNEKLTKEKETLNDELNRCVEKSAKVSYLEGQIASLKQEEKSWEQQTQGLKGQLSVSHEKVQSLEESLQNVNIQMSRIKSDLRVAQQEKEALKQEVMSLHKQLQNANAKNQVLEMTVQSSGLQNNQKKRYWDDLEQLMEQEQHILRQENERLQKEVHNTKSELALSREKIRQMESTLLSLKQQKQHSQSSMVKILEREKSSLRQECDHLQKELMLANRKISQMSSLNRESMKMENEGLRSNSGKYDEHLIDTLHSASSVMVNHSPLHQQACAADPKDQYLYLQQQLQQADRRSQQQQATSRSSETVHQPQGDTEQMLMKMEKRMIEVEQKLRIVKMLLQEKVNQLKEQLTKNTKADAKIKDLYVENSRLLKALEMSEQRQQTTEKKNYLLEEKISGLSKIVKELAPCAVTPGLSPQRRFS